MGKCKCKLIMNAIDRQVTEQVTWSCESSPDLIPSYFQHLSRLSITRATIHTLCVWERGTLELPWVCKQLVGICQQSNNNASSLLASASRAITMQAAYWQLPAEQLPCSMLRIVTSSGCCKRHCLTNMYLRLPFDPRYQIQHAFHTVNCSITPDP